MVASSSGLGRLVLIQVIAGSNPAATTRNKNSHLWLIFISVVRLGLFIPPRLPEMIIKK